MRKRINRPTMQTQESDTAEKQQLPLSYPASEDIYVKSHNEVNINPENTAEIKSDTVFAEKDSYETISGSELDVPGAELDDAQEIIGNEDEENNYYSLGGNNHTNLEEKKGE